MPLIVACFLLRFSYTLLTYRHTTLLQFLQRVGNKSVNMHLEALLGTTEGARKPVANTPLADKAAYVRMKYLDLKIAAPNIYEFAGT